MSKPEPKKHGPASRAGSVTAELFALRAQRQLDARRIKDLERVRDELQARIDRLAASNQTLTRTVHRLRKPATHTER